MKRQKLDTRNEQAKHSSTSAAKGTVIAIVMGVAALSGCARLERVPMAVLEPSYSYAQDPLVRFDPFDPFDRGEGRAAVASLAAGTAGPEVEAASTAASAAWR